MNDKDVNGKKFEPDQGLYKRDPEQYLDWTSYLFLDPSLDLLEFDMPAHAPPAPLAPNPIMQKIQYQDNVHLNKPPAGPPAGPHSRAPTPLHNGSPLQTLFAGDVHSPYPKLAHPLHSPYQPNGPPGTQPGALHTQGPYRAPPGAVPPQEFRNKSRRPCDHCRRRKIRCVAVAGSPVCERCEATGKPCTFDGLLGEPAAKRARVDPDPAEAVPPNVAIRNVAPVQDYLAMQNSLLKKTLLLQFPRLSFYIGPTAYLFDTNLLDSVIAAQSKAHSAAGRPPTLLKIEQVNLSDAILLRKVDDATQFVLKDDQLKLLFQKMSNDVDMVEKYVAPHGQILIDLYFRIIHPLYPILHKKVFLEKYSRTHREFSAPLLGAVYSLAIQWWEYDPQLNRFPKPNVERILKISLDNYILDILKRPKLSAVQAGLLLLQCKPIIRDLHVTELSGNKASASLTSSFGETDYNDWVLCSQVVALAEELGLGLDCDNWKLPKWERGLRKRLAWAVYLEDKWLALENSRPSHIHDLNWVVLDLAEEDFPEKHGDGDLQEGSSDITNGKRNFMHLISLSKILSEICTDLFSMRAMKDVKDIHDVLRIAKPIQLRLRTWYHSLPAELQMNSVQPRKLCANGYLQLAYFASELSLHRKIITTLYQQSQTGVLIPQELMAVCRLAAKTRLLAAIDFVRDLKPEHIHSFWHLLSSANFTLIGTFAALLFISSTSTSEANLFKEHVFNYRWILKISSKGFLQVGDSLDKLDLVLNHVPGLLSEMSESPAFPDHSRRYANPQPQNKHLPLGPNLQNPHGPYALRGLPRLPAPLLHLPHSVHIQPLPTLAPMQGNNVNRSHAAGYTTSVSSQLANDTLSRPTVHSPYDSPQTQPNAASQTTLRVNNSSPDQQSPEVASVKNDNRADHTGTPASTVHTEASVGSGPAPQQPESASNESSQ